MEETLSISGTVETVVYANEQTGYAVLEVADERDGELYTAVGPLCEVRAGEEVTLHGRFAMHPTFGQQFKTESYEVRLPETAAAIRRYLSGGALPHIGKAIAARIVAAFGEESLEVIASQPEVLATVKGLTREKAYEASREFQKNVWRARGHRVPGALAASGQRCRGAVPPLRAGYRGHVAPRPVPFVRLPRLSGFSRGRRHCRAAGPGIRFVRARARGPCACAAPQFEQRPRLPACGKAGAHGGAVFACGAAAGGKRPAPDVR